MRYAKRLCRWDSKLQELIWKRGRIWFSFRQEARVWTLFLEEAWRLGQLRRYSESLEQERLNYAILSVLPAKWISVKVEGLEWQCTLTQRGLSDQKG